VRAYVRAHTPGRMAKRKECSRRRAVASTPTGRRPTPRRRQPTAGRRSELLISSPRRGRAFLGTVKSQSTLQPRLLDERVSGVILVDWAAWAASTTFSSTGLGYEMHEVDALRSAVRDTFLGVKPMIILGPPEMQREKKALSQPR
jgi:hypothetical protein